MEIPAELTLEVSAPARPYWDAFWVLSAGRTMGGGMTGIPNPLAVSEILAYARMRGLPALETLTLIQQLDRTWLELVHGTLRASMADRKQASA